MDFLTVLSPHQDDAALSLAITIGAMLRAGRQVRIINCFTVSNYAPHSSAASVAEVWRIRRQEDREFAARMGAGVEVVDLGWRDAPLRLGCPVSEVRRRKMGGREVDEAGQIADSLIDQVKGILLVPLGLGAHIDHLVAREAGLRMASAGQPVGFYEDLPYAAELRECCILREADGLPRRIGASLRGALIRHAGGAAPKRFAIEAYRSQLSAEQVQSVIDYGESIDGCERLWVTETLAGMFPIPIDRVEARAVSGAAHIFRMLRCATHLTADRAGALFRRMRQLNLRGDGVNVPEPN